MEELDGSAPVGRGLDGAWFAGLPFVVVVAGGAVRAAERSHGAEAFFDDGGYPCFFALFGNFDGGRSLVEGVADDVGQVGGEFVEEVREVRGERGLADLHEEAVREPAALHAVQCRHAGGPFFGQGLAAASDDFVAGPAGVGGSHFKAGGEDDAVDFVFDSVDHQAVFGDPVDAFPGGVDEFHVGSVERRQVLVVERGAFAEHPVVGLEFLGDFRGVDEAVDPGSDFVHLVEVGHLEDLGNVGAAVGLGVAEAADHHADQIGPPVVDQVFGLGNAGDEAVEVLHSLFLPSGLKTGDPLGVGGFVASHIHRRGGALEHVEVLGCLAEKRHALDGAGTGADHRDPLVAQPVKVPVGPAAGVVVVPSAGVERVALEVADAGDAGEFRPVEGPVGHGHEPGSQSVAPVGGDDPPGGVFVPGHTGDFRLEHHPVVEPVVLAETPAVVEDLPGVRVFLLGDVADFFEERQVDVGLDVALGSRVPVPVPGAAEIAAFFDDPQVFHAGFAEAGSHLEAAEAASDDDHVDLVGERRPVDGRFDVRVIGVMGELSDDLDVLVVSVGAQPFVPFDAVAVPHGVGIEAALGGAGGFSLSAGGTQRWGPSPRSCGAVNKRIGERSFKILGWLRPGPLTRSGVRSSSGLAFEYGPRWEVPPKPRPTVLCGQSMVSRYTLVSRFSNPRRS